MIHYQLGSVTASKIPITNAIFNGSHLLNRMINIHISIQPPHPNRTIVGLSFMGYPVFIQFTILWSRWAPASAAHRLATHVAAELPRWLEAVGFKSSWKLSGHVDASCGSSSVSKVVGSTSMRAWFCWFLKCSPKVSTTVSSLDGGWRLRNEAGWFWRESGKEYGLDGEVWKFRILKSYKHHRTSVSSLNQFQVMMNSTKIATSHTIIPFCTLKNTIFPQWHHYFLTGFFPTIPSSTISHGQVEPSLYWSKVNGRLGTELQPIQW